MDYDTKLKALVTEAAKAAMVEEPGTWKTLKEAKASIAESMIDTLSDEFCDP